MFLLGALVGSLATLLAIGTGCPDTLRRNLPLAVWLGSAPAAPSGSQSDAATNAEPGEAASRAARPPLARRSRAGADRRGAASHGTAAGGPPGGEETPTNLAETAAPGSPAAQSGSPAAPPAAGALLRDPSATRIALVIDDLGRSLQDLDNLRSLGIPIAYAVLPFETQTPEVVAALRRRHEEILCHLPMEPRSGPDPGPGALRAAMTRDQLRQATLAALAAVPGATGVNNHMGSSISADPASMAVILTVVGSHNLFFLDSRTSAQSVAYRLAAAMGIPAAERQVFLDDDLTPTAIADQFHHLLTLARTRGEAIAIGHPHSATLATLATEVPRAQALGYHFVHVSALLDRPTAPPLVSGR